MPKVGGEIDAFCTKCNMLLNHTVIALVGTKPIKVECLTCHGVHKYRGTEGSTGPSSPKPRVSRASSGKVVSSFDDVIKGKDISRARRYSPKETYRNDEVIDHPTFGLGYITAIRDPGKIEVTFRSSVKTLIQNKAS
jgi:hypothetical protein